VPAAERKSSSLEKKDSTVIHENTFKKLGVVLRERVHGPKKPWAISRTSWARLTREKALNRGGGCHLGPNSSVVQNGIAAGKWGQKPSL